MANARNQVACNLKTGSYADCSSSQSQVEKTSGCYYSQKMKTDILKTKRDGKHSHAMSAKRAIKTTAHHDDLNNSRKWLNSSCVSSEGPDDDESLDSGYDGHCNLDKADRLHYYCFPDKGITVIAEGDWESQCDTASVVSVPEVEGCSEARQHEADPGWDSDGTLKLDDCVSSGHKFDTKRVKQKVDCSGNDVCTRAGQRTLTPDLSKNKQGRNTDTNTKISLDAVDARQRTPSPSQSTVHGTRGFVPEKDDLITTWIATANWRGAVIPKDLTYPGTSTNEGEEEIGNRKECSHETPAENHTKTPAIDYSLNKLSALAKQTEVCSQYTSSMPQDWPQPRKNHVKGNPDVIRQSGARQENLIVNTKYHRYTIDDIVENYCKILGDINDLEASGQTSRTVGKNNSKNKPSLASPRQDEVPATLRRNVEMTDIAFERSRMRRSIRNSVHKDDMSSFVVETPQRLSKPQSCSASLLCGFYRQTSSRASQIRIKCTNKNTSKKEIFL